MLQHAIEASRHSALHISISFTSSWNSLLMTRFYVIIVDICIVPHVVGVLPSHYWVITSLQSQLRCSCSGLNVLVTLCDISSGRGPGGSHLTPRQWSYYRMATFKSAKSPWCNTSATSKASKGQWWKFELHDTSATSKAWKASEILNYLLSH